jgi:hypothetical protein
LLALNLAGVFFLVYGIIVTELRSRQERRERKRLRAAYSEIKRLQLDTSTEQQELSELPSYDSQQGFRDDPLKHIKQLQTELNQRVAELEREL